MTRLKRLIKSLACLLLLLTASGCTSIILQRQGSPQLQAQARKSCPELYQLTRLDLASLEWALMDDKQPSDPCLALYHPKAAKDPFYASMNAYLSPLYVFSLPVDVMIDSLALPFALASLDY